jgi:hypothetical protein
MEAAGSFRTLVPLYQMTNCHTLKTVILIFTAAKTWNLDK